MTQVPEADLLTICRGAAMELFQKALAVVNANIKDPNTNPTQGRPLQFQKGHTVAPEKSYPLCR
jgi:hypothetical protein